MSEYIVTEGCPHCDTEVSVVWKPEEDGYEIYCPKCGTKIMLCSECPYLQDEGRCDWKADFNGEGNCKMKATSKLVG